MVDTQPRRSWAVCRFHTGLRAVILRQPGPALGFAHHTHAYVASPRKQTPEFGLLSDAPQWDAPLPVPCYPACARHVRAGLGCQCAGRRSASAGAPLFATRRCARRRDARRGDMNCGNTEDSQLREGGTIASALDDGSLKRAAPAAIPVPDSSTAHWSSDAGMSHFAEEFTAAGTQIRSFT